jgi:hypothetical protein
MGEASIRIKIMKAESKTTKRPFIDGRLNFAFAFMPSNKPR